MEREQGSQNLTKEANHILVYEGRLGGCAVNGDGATYYPRMWGFMIDKLELKSVIDVGCGSGMAADYFLGRGLKVLGVEGCKAAIEHAVIPQEMIVCHDYEAGPFEPTDEYDLAWSAEFVEHVDHNCRHNYFATFKKCKYIAMTFATPMQGGHNHVNEQPMYYWVNEIQALGYRVDWAFTAMAQEYAKMDADKYSPFFKSHFIEKGLVFRRA